MDEAQAELAASYDRVARQYAAEYFDEFAHKPFDCALLDGFAAEVRGQGLVCEIGCGPGQVARYLRARGVEMHGVDLSEEMVNHARRLNPDITFAQGDMLALDAGDATFAGLISFYAIIHLKRGEVTRALGELWRVLRPGAPVLISFHGGAGEVRRAEWYGEPVSVCVTLFTSEEMSGYLKAAGFVCEHIFERAPYPFEYPTPRLYARARKPATM
ncbi:MAG: class I SAM-dependent methyltransferase [Pyrinomonadaceae bacterium]